MRHSPSRLARVVCNAILLTLISPACIALDITLQDGRIYRNAEITRVEPDALLITHSDGLARVRFENLPLDLQKKYSFDPVTAAQYRAQVEARRAAAAKSAAEAQAKKNPTKAEPAKSAPIASATPSSDDKRASNHNAATLDSWVLAQWHIFPWQAQLGLCVALVILALAGFLRLTRRIERKREWKRVCDASDAYFDLLDSSEGMPVASTNILLQNGEKAYYSEPSSLYETRAVRHYQSGMAGFRVAKGVWVGGSRGRSVSNQEWTKLDTGTLTITNQRVVFRGGRETRTVPLERIVSVDALRDSVDIGVANRQKSMTFGAANPLILATIIRLACKGYDSTPQERDQHEVNGTSFGPPPPVNPSPNSRNQRTHRSVPNPYLSESDYDIHSRTLGLSGYFSFADVKRRYYERIKEYHPDKVAALGPKLRELAEEESKKINEAYRFFTERFEANENA